MSETPGQQHQSQPKSKADMEFTRHTLDMEDLAATAASVMVVDLVDMAPGVAAVASFADPAVADES
jgi:hypothetical protein